MRPVGVHYLGEFFNCSCNDLDDSAKLAEIIENAVIKNGFSLVETVSHRFNPVGVT
ncbi:S-adenosylmethionine decarboxylase, partial [bacterium]|nr:S-adenosylmethionine decarboxylase [bacterium]